MPTLREKAAESLQEIRQQYLGEPELSEIALAATLGRANVLLWGSFGKGKSLLPEVIARVTNASYSRVQGTAGLTESKFLARYNIAELVKGNEKIEWKPFLDAEIKMIDEVNRSPPVVINSFFTMLAERKVFFGSETRKILDYALFASMNPADEGTHALAPPFLDRFDLCLLTPSLSFYDKRRLLSEGAGNLERVQTVLEKGELKKMWGEVEQIKVNPVVFDLIAGTTRDLQLCKYGEKEFLTDFPACCAKCEFNQQVCAKLDNRSPASERLHYLTKVLKGLAYLNGEKEAGEKEFFKTLKYALNHRLNFTPGYLKQQTNFKESVTNLITQLQEKEKDRKDAYPLVKKLEEGFDEKSEEQLQKYAKNDLLLRELAKGLDEKWSRAFAALSKKIPSLDAEELSAIRAQVGKQLPKRYADGAVFLVDERLQQLLYIEKTLTKRELESFLSGFGNPDLLAHYREKHPRFSVRTPNCVITINQTITASKLVDGFWTVAAKCTEVKTAEKIRALFGEIKQK